MCYITKLYNHEHDNFTQLLGNLAQYKITSSRLLLFDSISQQSAKLEI